MLFVQYIDCWGLLCLVESRHLHGELHVVSRCEPWSVKGLAHNLLFAYGWKSSFSFPTQVHTLSTVVYPAACRTPPTAPHVRVVLSSCTQE